MDADSLAVSACYFKIHDKMLVQYKIQVKYRPYIPDNLKHWKIFDDGEQLKSFLQVIDEFSNMQVEEEQLDNIEIENKNQTPQFDSKIVEHRIIQLSKKFIPKGLITLEMIFYHNDVPKNSQSDSHEENIEIYNIGSSE